MYVKLFNQILDSSIADNRKLRHFFTDLLLCSDPDGNVLMTKTAIHHKTRASMEEVEWGIAELMKPEDGSGHPDMDGRRIVPLEGHGYGWKIVNYELYRDMKSSRQKREETAERVRRFREKKRLEENAPQKKRRRDSEDLPSSALTKSNERRAVAAAEVGNIELHDRIAAGEA